MVDEERFELSMYPTSQIYSLLPSPLGYSSIWYLRQDLNLRYHPYEGCVLDRYTTEI